MVTIKYNKIFTVFFFIFSLFFFDFQCSNDSLFGKGNIEGIIQYFKQKIALDVQNSWQLQNELASEEYTPEANLEEIRKYNVQLTKLESEEKKKNKEKYETYVTAIFRSQPYIDRKVKIDELINSFKKNKEEKKYYDAYNNLIELEDIFSELIGNEYLKTIFFMRALTDKFYPTNLQQDGKRKYGLIDELQYNFLGIFFRDVILEKYFLLPSLSKEKKVFA